MQIDSKRMALFFILLAGLILRVWGINFGLPFIYHTDEPIIVNHALAYGTGDLNPHFFMIPPLTSYVVFFFYGIFFIVGKVIGLFSIKSDFLFLYISDPTIFYIIARLSMGALLGTATVYITYLVAKKVYSAPGALISAFLLAVAFLHVRDSHYVYCDIPLVFSIMLLHIFLYKIYNKGDTVNYVAAGIIAGIATAFKYNGVVLLVPIVVVHMVKNAGNIRRILFDGRIFLSVFCFASAFIVLNPFSVLDFSTFSSDVYMQLKPMTNLEFFHHIRYSIPQGMSLALALISVLGFMVLILKRFKETLWLNVFFVIYLLLISLKSQNHERYALPLVPFLCIYAAAGIVMIGNIFRSSRHKIFLTAALAVLISMPTLIKTIYLDYLLTKPDTRTLAKEWVENNVKPRSVIAISERLSPPVLTQTAGQIKEKIVEAKGAQKEKLEAMLDLFSSKEKSYFVYYLKDKEDVGSKFFSDKPNLSFDIHELRSAKTEYVILVIFNMTNKLESFRQEVRGRGALMTVMNPYREYNIENRSQKSTYSTTAAPLSTTEVFNRLRCGPYIEIYKLSSN